jgi:protoporphyrinogen oxidase
MVEVPHAPGDDVDRMDDDALLLRTSLEVARLGVDLTRDVRFAFSVRAPEAYPVHRRGVEAARAAALDALSTVTNLRTFGRQGAFRFIFADAALRMGLLAAEGLAAGRAPSNRDLAAVASAPALLEVESLVGADAGGGVASGA